MGTKYTTEAISGYNSSPPADDGSTAASNQVKWSTIKQKLPDPLKASIESINSKLVTALDFTARVVTSADSTVAGDHMRTLEVPTTVTSTFTISLGDAATMANGYIVRIRNSSAVDITVGRVTSGDTINGAAANVLLPVGAAMTFAANASGNGYYAVAETSGLVLLSTATASASATVDFTSGIGSTYNAYVVKISGMVAATNATELWLRVTEDGSNFKSGASDYTYCRIVNGASSLTPSGSGSTGDTKLSLAVSISSAAGSDLSAEVMFYSPTSSNYKKFKALTTYYNSGNEHINGSVAGAYIGTTNAITGIRFLMSSGNITSGNFSLYGVRK